MLKFICTILSLSLFKRRGKTIRGVGERWKKKIKSSPVHSLLPSIVSLSSSFTLWHDIQYIISVLPNIVELTRATLDFLFNLHSLCFECKEHLFSFLYIIILKYPIIISRVLSNFSFLMVDRKWVSEWRIWNFSVFYVYSVFWPYWMEKGSLKKSLAPHN